MLPSIALALVLQQSAPSADAARAELETLAARIEVLKARQLDGADVERELERLLVRAQEVAASLERAEPPPVPTQATPGAEELRERADALHDDADRLAGVVAALDVKIADARRALGGTGGRFDTAALSSGAQGGPELARLQALIQERGRAAERLAALRAEAAAMEEEARAREGER